MDRLSFGLAVLEVNEPAWHSTHDMAFGQSSMTQARSSSHTHASIVTLLLLDSRK